MACPITRRRGLSSAATLVFLNLAGLGASSAQSFPNRPVQLIVPFSAGSSTDIAARAFADGLSAELGQSAVVLNREGASGTIALTAAANAVPDGHTLVISPQGPLTIQPHLKSNLPYRLDIFHPVCQIFEDAFAIAVGKNSPIPSFDDLINRARKKPKALTFGSSGVATVPHLQMEGIARSSGIEIVHAPYRTYGQLLPDLLSGRLDFTVAPVAVIAGTAVRVLAIIGANRNAIFPAAPTLRELGDNTAMPGIGGLYVQRAAPATVHARLEQACTKAFAAPSFNQAIAKVGMSPAFLPHSEFTQRLADDSKQTAALIKALGISTE